MSCFWGIRLPEGGYGMQVLQQEMTGEVLGLDPVPTEEGMTEM